MSRENTLDIRQILLPLVALAAFAALYQYFYSDTNADTDLSRNPFQCIRRCMSAGNDQKFCVAVCVTNPHAY